MELWHRANRLHDTLIRLGNEFEAIINYIGEQEARGIHFQSGDSLSGTTMNENGPEDNISDGEPGPLEGQPSPVPDRVELNGRHTNIQPILEFTPAEPKLARQMSTPAKLINELSSPNKMFPTFVDMGIFYSSPLVEPVEKHGINYPLLLDSDGYNFAEDTWEYVKILEASQLQLCIDVECASLDQFVKMIRKKPKILQLTCHSGWSLDSKEWALYFENNRLELLRVHPNVLAKMIGTQLKDIHLVIIAVPNAHNFVQIFLEAGVRAVIHINSDHSVAYESLVRYFCKELYSQLLQKLTVQQAFKNAVNYIQSENIDRQNCCCFHSHKKTCRVGHLHSVEGPSNIHALHDAWCQCPKKNSCIHSGECAYVQTMVTEHGYLTAILEQGDNLLRVCCCSPEIFHDSAMRLHLHASDLADQPIFLDLKEGRVRYANNIPYKEPIFREQIFMGLEKVLYQLYNAVLLYKRRVILIFGATGSGKTWLAKQFSNILAERNIVSEVKHVNMENISNLNVLVSRISGLSNVTNHRSCLERIPKNSNFLVVLENINCLLETNPKEFYELLEDIIEQTRLKLLIVARFNETLFTGDNHQVIQFSEEVVHMPSMCPLKAARLFQILTQSEQRGQEFHIDNLISHSALKVKGRDKLMPKKIYDLAYLVNKGMTITDAENTLEADLQHTLSTNIQEENVRAKRLLLALLSTERPLAAEIWSFVASFPKGLLLSDIESAAETFNWGIEWAETIFILMQTTDIDSLNTNIQQWEKIISRMKSKKLSAVDIVHSGVDAIHAERVTKEWVFKVSSEAINGTQQYTVIASDGARTAFEGGFMHIERTSLFYRGFLGNLIIRYKALQTETEGLICSNQLSQCSHWQDILSSLPFPSSTRSLSIIQMQVLLRFHEANLRMFLTGTDGKAVFGGIKIIAQQGSQGQKFMALLEDLLTKVLTVFSSPMAPDEISRAEMLAHVRQIIGDSYELGMPMRRLDIKAELCGLDLSGKKVQNRTDKEEKEVLKQHVQMTDELLELYDSPDQMQFKMELIIIQLALHLNRVKMIANLHRPDKLVDELRQLLRAAPSDPGEPVAVLRCKGYLAMYMYMTSQETVLNTFQLGTLRQVFQLFINRGLGELAKKACELLAKDTAMSRQERRGLFAEGARLALMNDPPKDRQALEWFEKKSIEEEDREKQESKKIVFMNSYIVRESDRGEYYLRLIRELRDYLYEDIRKTYRQLRVQFDEFDLPSFKKLLENPEGCRMCVIDLPVGNMEGMDTDECKLHIESPVSTNLVSSIDILLVLGDPSDSEFQDILGSARFKYVIRLDLSTKVISKLDLLNLWLVSEFKYVFLKHFVVLIVQGIAVESALKDASQQAIGELHSKLVHIKLLQLSVNGESRLVPSEEIDLSEYFASAIRVDRNNPPEKFSIRFNSGKLDEIETVYSRRKLFKIKAEPVQRDNLNLWMQKVLEDNQVVNLYGRKGIGKTTFVQSLLNQLIAKDMYKDGVKIFKLKQFALACERDKIEGNIKDLMRGELGREFEENAEGYFQGKDMLVVFEDFHYITKKKMLVFPVTLIQALVRSSVRVLLVTAGKVRSQEYLSLIRPIKMERLGTQEALMEMLHFNFLQDRTLLKFDADIFHRLAHSKYLIRARGIPEKIQGNSWKFLTRTVGLRLHGDVCSVSLNSDVESPLLPKEGKGEESDPRALSEMADKSENTLSTAFNPMVNIIGDFCNNDNRLRGKADIKIRSRRSRIKRDSIMPKLELKKPTSKY